MKSETRIIKRKEKEGQKFLRQNKDFYFDGSQRGMTFILSLVIFMALPCSLVFHIARYDYDNLLIKILSYIVFSAVAIFFWALGIFLAIKFKHYKENTKLIKQQGQKNTATIKKIFCYSPKNIGGFDGYSFIFEVDGVLHTTACTIRYTVWGIKFLLPKTKNLKFDEVDNVFFIDIVEKEVPIIVFENKFLFTDVWPI